MNSTSSRILEIKKPVDHAVVEVLERVSKVMARFNVEYVLAGATARDIILTNVFALQAGRKTNDLDFGIVVRDWPQYSEIRQALLATCRFQGDKSAQRLLYLYGEAKLKVDLIPFGPIQNNEIGIKWPPKNEVEMNVIGFEDALRDAINVRINPELVVPVASPAGLMLLKLVAWRDRKWDFKDAPDILKLLRDYSAAGNEDRLYSAELAILEEAEFDLEIAGARLLGKDVASLASDISKNTIRTLLDSEKTRSEMIGQLVQSYPASNNPVDRCSALLGQFMKGFSAADAIPQIQHTNGSARGRIEEVDAEVSEETAERDDAAAEDAEEEEEEDTESEELGAREEENH
jgi:predicted nucleotidyltransferase